MSVAALPTIDGNDAIANRTPTLGSADAVLSHVSGAFPIAGRLALSCATFGQLALLCSLEQPTIRLPSLHRRPFRSPSRPPLYPFMGNS